MKKSFYYLIGLGLFLASCGSHKSSKVPFGAVPNDTAILMVKKYNSQPPTADTSYSEVPRMYGFDTKTLESIIANSNEGKVVAVNFMIAAYLDARPMYLKNTILMQIGREKDKKIYYYFYDLREPLNTLGSTEMPSLPLCPPPPDCVPPGIGPVQ